MQIKVGGEEGERKRRTSNKHLNFMFSQHNTSSLEKSSIVCGGDSSRWKSWSTHWEWRKVAVTKRRKMLWAQIELTRWSTLVQRKFERTSASVFFHPLLRIDKESIFRHWAMQISAAATLKLFQLFALVLKRLIYPPSLLCCGISRASFDFMQNSNFTGRERRVRGKGKVYFLNDKSK